MNGLMKVLTGILGVMAVIACLATVGVIGYALSGGGSGSGQQTDTVVVEATPTPLTSEATPTVIPTSDNGTQGQVINLADHIHNYEESVDIKATCYQAGRLLYTCSECGDYYYVDVHSTGHVPDDWEILRQATATEDGIRVQRCIYCDEIVAQETIVYEGSGDGEGSNASNANHVHEYTAEVDREPTCILAGLRRYTCTCGDFYTEPIPAKGHVATDWTEVEAATTTMLGREQRTCTVCGVVLDSRPIAALSPSASPAASGSGSSSGNATTAPTAASTASAQASAAPSATPHTHNYASYVIKEANCQEKGIRSFVCSGCGSSYAEEIDLDLNKHSYQAIVIPPTNATMGYTLYRCIRCNDTYMDNYLPALGGR